MKSVLFALLSISFTLHASTECKDKNLNGLGDKIDFYYELKTLDTFEYLGEFESAAPAGIQDTFGSGDNTCREVKATYFKYIDGTNYAIYTTHDDYCDGGNTIGVMINMSLYQSVFSYRRHGALKIEDSIVAYIGDSEIECVEANQDLVKKDPLTKVEAQKIEDYLNDICGDTFCGGDVDYNISNFVCTKEACTLDVHGSYYYDEDDNGSFINKCDLSPIVDNLRKETDYDKKEDMVYDFVVFGSCLDPKKIINRIFSL